MKTLNTDEHIESVVHTEEGLFEWEWGCPECGQRHMSLTETPKAETMCDSCDEEVQLVMKLN